MWNNGGKVKKKLPPLAQPKAKAGDSPPPAAAKRAHPYRPSI